MSWLLKSVVALLLSWSVLHAQPGEAHYFDNFYAGKIGDEDLLMAWSSGGGKDVILYLRDGASFRKIRATNSVDDRLMNGLYSGDGYQIRLTNGRGTLTAISKLPASSTTRFFTFAFIEWIQFDLRLRHMEGRNVNCLDQKSWSERRCL